MKSSADGKFSNMEIDCIGIISGESIALLIRLNWKNDREAGLTAPSKP